MRKATVARFCVPSRFPRGTRLTRLSIGRSVKGIVCRSQRMRLLSLSMANSVLFASAWTCPPRRWMDLSLVLVHCNLLRRGARVFRLLPRGANRCWAAWVLRERGQQDRLLQVQPAMPLCKAPDEVGLVGQSVVRRLLNGHLVAPLLLRAARCRCYVGTVTGGVRARLMSS